MKRLGTGAVTPTLSRGGILRTTGASSEELPIVSGTLDTFSGVNFVLGLAHDKNIESIWSDGARTNAFNVTQFRLMLLILSSSC